ncbi:MAG: hypothetical protein IPM54_20110 [Polyangiaceae bacterium]|nr:hypothetical protein [Polyangiaceae bacterium]
MAEGLRADGVASSRADDRGSERDANANSGSDGASGVQESECIPVLVDVRIAGSYTHDMSLPPLILTGPSLIAEHLVPSDGALQAKLWTTITFGLAWPPYAAAYSIEDLCSAEETQPSYHRFVCIDIAGELKTIEYRIEQGRTLVIIDNGKEVGRGDGSNTWFVTPMPSNACASITTTIPKRNLIPLKNAHLNDNPSERCRDMNATRRKVRATLVHEPLPKGHVFYEMGKLQRTSTPPYRYCRGITMVRLILPPAIAPSQDLGLLSAQCVEVCNASRDDNPRSVAASCFEGGKVHAYQLGDSLYVVEDDRVRQVPLPCDVDLDFRIADFAAQLGLPPPSK